MKILMVSTFRHGGATIAARRQKEALRDMGYVCDLVSITEDRNISEIIVIRNESEITISVPANAWSYSGRITTAYCSNNRTDISNTWFSFWPCETFFDEVLLTICLEYDVIHLHWIAQMVSSRLIAKLNAHRKRLVITSHDMNHFTGGCHYSAGCTQYIDGCNDCPQLISDPLGLVTESFQNKISTLSLTQATWLFPSKWLEGAYRVSKLYSNPHASKVLYNCIDTNKFKYLSSHERIESRLSLGFSEDEIVFISGAADNTELRKGFSYIEHGINCLSTNSLTSINNKKSLVIVTFGYGKPCIKTDSPFIRHLHLGSIDEQKVINLFQAADLLLFPSIEENFSNTILESLMCGCPVLAFRIGGVPDIVIHEQNGLIVEEVSRSAFADSIEQALTADNLSILRKSTQIWRDTRAHKYSYETIGSELMHEYIDNNNISRAQISSVHPHPVANNIYNELFRKSTIHDDSHDHLMLAANIAECISLENNNNHSDARLLFSPLVLRAIYGGFRAEKHPDFGRVTWLKKHSFVLFKATENTRPALCIGAPNNSWIREMLDNALPNLNAKCNGFNADVTRLITPDNGRMIYIWIKPPAHALLMNGYNNITLTFSEASIPEINDPRGLCILHSFAMMFNLNIIQNESNSTMNIDYATTSELCIGGDQSHYIHHNWSKLDNEIAEIPAIIELWIDSIENNKNDAWSAT